MNATYKNNSFGSALLGSFVVLALAMTFSFGLVQTVHAQDYGGDYSYTPDYGGGYSGGYDYGYNGGCCDYSYTPDYSYNYTPDAGYSYTPDSGYSYTPDSGYTYTPDAGYTYTPDTYSSGSSYSVGLGGGYAPGWSGYGGYSYPSWGGYGGGGYNYSNVNTNTNYQYTYSSCVGTNNCNTVNTTVNNPSPTVTYTSPSYSYPVYSYPSYTTAYTAPIAVTGTTNPYVSLSAIPYTGLKLGFWGTIAYWSFLILWCLFVAYLIVVKRVQDKFVAFLFGEKETAPTHVHAEPAHIQSAHHVHVAPAATVSKPVDAIDPFIMAQIHNRANA